MNIIVNANPHDVIAATLDAVLLELGYPKTSIATAVNGVFVPGQARATTILRQGDRVEVLSPMQGG